MEMNRGGGPRGKGQKTMRNPLTYRRRAAAGLAAMSAGAALLVLGVAGPASAHGDQEPEQPKAPVDLSCLELADFYEVDQTWTEFKITDLPDSEDKTDYEVDGVGTVSIKITDDGSILEWWSTFGIDAVYVNGTNPDQGSYFYLYAPGADDDEATHDYHLGVPPWNNPSKNQIKSVSFCYDDEEQPPTTAPPTTTPPTTETPSTTEAPTTSVPEETTTTVEESTTSSTAPAPSTEAPTTAPPTTETPGGGLPVTGSNTGLLVAVGAGLLAIGAALVAARRQIWRRFAS
jgi:LPXTG-motif cell wall-anchored protein